MEDRARLKYAFLSGCADAGLTLPETTERLNKLASLDKRANPWLDSARGLGWNGYMMALLGAFGVGGLAGYAGRSIAGGAPKTVDEMKNQEMAHVYRTFAQRVNQRKKLRDLRTGGVDELIADQDAEKKQQATGADYVPLF